MLDIMWNCCSGNVPLTFGEGDDFHIKNANIGMSLPGQWYRSYLGFVRHNVGYEVEASASNPNVDRHTGYDLEPFTHTGLLASTQLMDNVSVSGLANEFDSTAVYITLIKMDLLPSWGALRSLLLTT